MSSTFLAFVNFPSFLSIPPRRRRLHIIKLNGRLRSNSQTSPVTNCKFLAIRFFFLTSGQVKALEEEIASNLSNSPDESNASKHICFNEVFSSAQAMRIPYNCPLARIRPHGGRYLSPEVVAVRVPLLHLSNFQINDWPELSAKSYAIMVLILPTQSARKWRHHELELVEVVADQVAVALSHAAILEESMRARDQLMVQNVALKSARREAEMAIHARNDFLAVMNHEMRTPMHAIIALSSLLLETELTTEQRAMIETVLKSSNLLAILTNDVLDLSRLEDGSLDLELKTFNLHELFKEVVGLIKPIASVKKLSMSLIMAPDLPACAVGDEKRLTQTILNVVGNAVKFTKEGYVSIVVSVAKPDSLRDWQPPEFYPMTSDGHFYLRMQVKDSGCGVLPQDVPHLFTKFAQLRSGSSRSNGGAGIGLAICKRFVTLMKGHIWIESEGLDKGTVTTFIVKLGLCNNPDDPSVHQAASRGRASHGSGDLMGHKPLFRDDGFASSNPRSLLEEMTRSCAGIAFSHTDI
ncbi:hypothetical protein DKX38_003276 [Salix brachista]|uniref:histidine kinase n=1 Tax=Salix brachista TaxID=2182728 RepID=A0A5N5NRS4_9ROSI|nr:hypothetical protein DKX38_003276 [Salix brachista]